MSPLPSLDRPDALAEVIRNLFPGVETIPRLSSGHVSTSVPLRGDRGAPNRANACQSMTYGASRALARTGCVCFLAMMGMRYQTLLLLLTSTLWSSDVRETLRQADVLWREGRLHEAHSLLSVRMTGDDWERTPVEWRASLTNNLASLCHDMGRLQDAERLYQSSIGLWKTLPGVTHEPARPINNLSTLYRQVGRLAEAEDLARQSLALRRRHLGETHEDVAVALQNMGVILEDRGRLADAAAAFREALALLERHPNRKTLAAREATVRLNIGRLQLRAGDYERALNEIEASLALTRSIYGERHPVVIEGLITLARAQTSAGRRKAAGETLDNLVPRMQEGAPASLQRECAEELRRLGRKKEAKALEATALGHPDQGEVTLARHRVHWRDLR